jgi:ABC-type sugar transport system ATPase subunit
MLGREAADLSKPRADRAAAGTRAADATPRLTSRAISSGTKLQDATFDLYPGEVLGVVALEGQGQDELFDVLAGSTRPSGGELLVDGAPVSFRHPADAIRAGLVCGADRAEALLMQRPCARMPRRRWRHRAVGPLPTSRRSEDRRRRGRYAASTRARALRSTGRPAAKLAA